MSILEQGGYNSELNGDDFGLASKRLFEHLEVDVNLILSRCKRLGVQPRDLLLKVLKKRGQSDDIADEITEGLSHLPDYNLDEDGELNKAKKEILNIYLKLQVPGISIDGIILDAESELEMQKKDKRAGIFSYEFEENNEIRLHVPATKESLKLSELKKSLKILTQVLIENPNITVIRGQSLLLEHHIAERLGFKIDTKSDLEVNSSFSMSREEFLQRFAK